MVNDDRQVARKTGNRARWGVSYGKLDTLQWHVYWFFYRLLYQIILKRMHRGSHNVRATNWPDLASFINDMELNITTISSMSCSQLRGIGSLVSGNPGFTNYKVCISLELWELFKSELISLVNHKFQVLELSSHSLISLVNHKLQVLELSSHSHLYEYLGISLIFLPVLQLLLGFSLSFTSKTPAHKKHVCFIGGTLKCKSS